MELRIERIEAMKKFFCGVFAGLCLVLGTQSFAQTVPAYVVQDTAEQSSSRPTASQIQEILEHTTFTQVMDEPNSPVSCELLWEFLNEYQNLIEDKLQELQNCPTTPGCSMAELEEDLRVLGYIYDFYVDLLREYDCPGAPAA